MAPVVIVGRIKRPINKVQLKQIVAAWNRMINAKAGNPWWKKADLKSKCEEQNRFISGNNFLYLVFNRQKKPIGEVSGGWLNRASAEMGYWLDPAYYGKGYMTIALKKVLNILKSKGCRKVLFSTRKSNEKSISLLRKLGAIYKGKEIRKRMGEKREYNKYEVLLK